MSKMAYVNPPETSVDMITQFGGYNHNISISDGEFFDMQNLCSDKYPLASIRGKRVKLGRSFHRVVNSSNSYYDGLSNIFNNGKYIVAENNGLFAIGVVHHQSGDALEAYKYNQTNNTWEFDGLADNYVVPANISLTNYVNMGAYIVMPEIKVLYNTITHKVIYMDFEQQLSGLEIALSPGTADANATGFGFQRFDGTTGHLGRYDLRGVTISSSEPSSPSNNQYWFDISEKTPKLKKFSESSGMWTNQPVYLLIYGDPATGFRSKDTRYADHFGGACFATDDAIEIDPTYGNINNYIGRKKDQKYWNVMYGSGDEYNLGDLMLLPIELSITACNNFANAADFVIGGVSARLRRRMPAADYITESNNRLWACRYGNDIFGNPVNEIYACKLGDPTNWHYFGNTSIDSYYLSLGVGGKFTGAMTYQSNPVFFKEDSVHRIYGNYPSNYQLKTVMGYGVKEGSDKSLTELNGNVYYLSNAGLSLYQGGTPVDVSTIFGDEKYTDGISASAGNKMYMSVKDSNNNRRLFVYDDRHDTWYQETGLPITQMLNYNSKIFCVASGDVYCLSEFNGLTSYESNVNWSFDTGKIGFASPLHKFINKITLRMRLALDAYASIYIQYDSDGNDTHVADIRPTGNVTTIAVPVIPHRCDHFNIRMQGAGKMELISLTKYYEETTDYD